jgi:hypothetical protein
VTTTEAATEIVTALYRALLRRAPDQVGLDHHVALMTSGETTLAEVISAFLNSREYKDRHGAHAPAEGEVAYRSWGSKHAAPYHVIDSNPDIFGRINQSYMQSANCVAADFFAPAFADFCKAIAKPVALHRKLWEFAFIAHHLAAKGVLREGSRGVGFGVGTEPLPALFASLGCKVLATDAPLGVADKEWGLTNQHSRSREGLFLDAVATRDVFDSNVDFAFADMNAIDEDIRDFDFCWSSCCFEHLGTIDKGLDFVETSIEKTLKVGGVACHTSELNLTSNTETTESGGTVLYRQKDIRRLIDRLERRGHRCEPLPFHLGDSFLDHLVDVPENGGDIHLRLLLGKFVITSFGIVTTRGR